MMTGEKQPGMYTWEEIMSIEQSRTLWNPGLKQLSDEDRPLRRWLFAISSDHFQAVPLSKERRRY
jgi:hypothetical protein